MSVGARFYKCDLHVHTPLDVGWRGERLIGSAASEALVRACYEAGLEIIGITDHNFASRDLLPEIVKQAGRLASEYGYTLRIFPGFELTANIGMGVHATCLFDPTADLEIVDRALTACGVPPDRFKDFVPAPSLKRLDQILSAVQTRTPKGVVICAHSQSGIFDDDKISEWLQAEEFRQPGLLCIEVSKPLAEMSKGWQTLLRAGEDCDEKWRRFRPVACIMCSDAKALRKSDDDKNYVAKRFTWIKMGPPTVEGLRHAFLAHESRVRLTQPRLPTMSVERIEVGACTFFSAQPFVLEFSSQFSALIGGRGTGKSTIIEYLRWALCDQPPETQADGIELRSAADRQASLIRNTLESQPEDKAYVRVTILKNATKHVVTRYAKNKRITLAIADAEAQDVTEDTVRHLVSAQAYSQKQLSGVAVKVTELRRLLEAPVRAELALLTKLLAEHRALLRAVYADLWRGQQLDREIKAAESAIRSSDAQAKAIKAEIEGGLSVEDRGILAAREPFLSQNQTIARIREDLSALGALITNATEAVAALPRDSAVAVAAPCRDAVATAIAQVLVVRDKLTLHLEAGSGLIASTATQIEVDLAECVSAFNKHEAAYADASNEATAYSGKLKTLDDLTRDLDTQRVALEAATQQRSQIKADPAHVAEKMDRWFELHCSRGDVLERVAREVEKQSEGDIRVEVRRGADVDGAFGLFRDSLKGSGARDEWMRLLSVAIADSASPANGWFKFVEQIRPLAEMLPEDSASQPLPSCPLLEAAGFTAGCMRKVAALLTTDRWLELLLTSLEDKPVFYFRNGEGKEIPFEDASAGQQATALLRVLLSQSGGPLIIDQPEEDLDNAIISQVVESIWAAKERRQLIFASHNANIVVNGDAELVIHCAYAEAHKRSLGVIERAGSIDEPAICQVIRDVMEGGDKAFQLRRAKYGF